MGVVHGRGLSVYCLSDFVVGYVDKMEFLLGNPYSTPVGQCIGMSFFRNYMMLKNSVVTS